MTKTYVKEKGKYRITIFNGDSGEIIVLERKLDSKTYIPIMHIERENIPDIIKLLNDVGGLDD